MKFFNTFRGRLLLILLLMLVATLGVQYYLNLLTQKENDDLREAQAQALVAGITLGFSGVTASSRVQDLVNDPDQTYFDQATKERIKDIIVIDDKWQVYDSLNPEYLPTYDHENDYDDYDDPKKVSYKKLSELTSLPPLMEGSRLGEDLKYFPNATASAGTDQTDEAHAIPIETSQGKWYVMVLLKNDKSEARWRAARPLIYTLGVLLVSSLITFVLVWRFARPIANLADAARQVAAGDLRVRVQNADRNDEMGRLASRFNEMTAELEKKQDLESKLQQAEKSAVVGRLGSAIAHEIRNPLNYINLTLDHLRSKFAPDDDRRAAFDKMTAQLKAEVARIDQQISDFLNYSRPAKAELRSLDARKVIEDSLRIVEAQAAEENVLIGIVEHENVPKVMGDPEFLRSVFNNLFINALQAMENTGGHLNIKIYPDKTGNLVNFDVADTACGISEENLSKIFEPYFSTKETGTGLGLAIVQKIVDIHHGSISVRSTVGEGTTLTIRLPASRE
jgi:signal transduction histidine kinase